MKKFFLIALLLSGVLFAGLFHSLVEAESTPIKSELRDAYKYPALETAPQAYTQEARLVSGISNDSFGQNVKISGDTAVVYTNAGFRVYARSGTTWVLEATLHPSDGDAVASFPRAMAISGNTVVVAGVSATINGNGGQGAAYVFQRTGTNWIQQARLTASDGVSGDGFARSVAINGDSIIVGAWLDDVGANSDQGSAYVFIRQSETWIEEAKLVAADGTANRVFGLITAIGGDYAAVGTGGIGGTPSDVYVFVRTGTLWSQQAKISVCEPSGNSGTSCFGGVGLAITSDLLAFGNSALNVAGTISAGGVYIFGRTGSTWTQQQRLTASDGLSEDGFGTSLSTDGNAIVVGAPGFDRPGSAYLFTFSDNTWGQQQKFQVVDGLNGSVSISGPRIILGAGGAAYIYTEGSVTPTPTPTPTPKPTPAAVTVSGRVVTPSGSGLRGATVTLYDLQGNKLVAATSSLGFYTFGGVAVGEGYALVVSSKRYRFSARIDLSIQSDLPNMDFAGLE
jgi:hypothetical protein